MYAIELSGLHLHKTVRILTGREAGKVLHLTSIELRCYNTDGTNGNAFLWQASGVYASVKLEDQIEIVED